MMSRTSILAATALCAVLSGCARNSIEMSTVSNPPEGWLPYPENAGPPPGWKGKVFELSADFPSELPQERPAFLAIDFRENPEAYWQAVRAYIYEGNINRGVNPAGHSLDWNTQTNPVRIWYNMPWRAWGPNAREFINGLTREFPASPGSLAPGQKHTAYTWARAIYNPIAGYTVGQVWHEKESVPAMAKGTFAEGAVIAKLLFTTAVEDDVPYVRDAYTWQANTYADPEKCFKEDCPRKVRDVHLYQIDFAIKDSRASETHWVFGTFVHDPSLPGKGFSWDKMVPLGFMWGNDPDLTASDRNGVPKESVIYDNTHIFEHLGCHGRLVGPLDNPKSACLSCHMNAQYPRKESPIPSGSFAQCDAAENPDNARYWSNLMGGDILWPDQGEQTYALDYSMEMTSSVENYFKATKGYVESSDRKTYRLTGSDQEHQSTRRHD